MTSLTSVLRRPLVPKIAQTTVHKWSLTDSDWPDLGDVPIPKPSTGPRRMYLGRDSLGYRPSPKSRGRVSSFYPRKARAGGGWVPERRILRRPRRTPGRRPLSLADFSALPCLFQIVSSLLGLLLPSRLLPRLFCFFPVTPGAGKPPKQNGSKRGRGGHEGQPDLSGHLLQGGAHIMGGACLEARDPGFQPCFCP